MASSHHNALVGAVRYLTERASDVYDTIDFNTDGLYNEPAPDEWISFMIGGIFSLIGLVLYVLRYKKLSRNVEGTISSAVKFRIMISSFIDNDDSVFTITKLAAQSFLFLGGLQYNYELTFSVMLGWFALESTSDTLRILSAFWEVNSLDELVSASSAIRSRLRNVTTQLKPSNVYEDISRTKVIVIMVFITQALLITFVVVDIYDLSTHTCHDGTAGCPVVGTLGSWAFYVLGIFMASVYLLGPKTSFGQSEQNPAYWLQLLISAKKTGSTVTWYDPVGDETKSQELSPDDWRIWIRFLMSFLVNGVGFHILVHALPIQVATQSSLTGVVFRAVGMMYLVDLDDTPGYTLTVVERVPEAEKPLAQDSTPAKEEAAVDVAVPTDISVQAQAIIDDAKAQLDALAATGHRGGAGRQKGGGLKTGVLCMAGGMGLAAGGVAAGVSADDGGDGDAGGEDGGGEDGGGDDGGAEA